NPATGEYDGRIWKPMQEYLHRQGGALFYDELREQVPALPDREASAEGAASSYYFCRWATVLLSRLCMHLGNAGTQTYSRRWPTTRKSVREEHRNYVIRRLGLSPVDLEETRQVLSKAVLEQQKATIARWRF